MTRGLPQSALNEPEMVDLAERQAERLLHLADLHGPATPSALIIELPRY